MDELKATAERLLQLANDEGTAQIHDAALQIMRIAEQKPVAWRCRCGMQNLWSYGTEEEVDYYIKQAGVQKFEKEALYLRPPLPNGERNNAVD
jgi:hypothetical protein